MVKYSCEKCGKEFSQKGHYTTHINKKNPCVLQSKIEGIIEDIVSKKINEHSTVGNILTKHTAIINDKRFIKQLTIDTNIHIPKPLLKWVGGKTQILDKLILEFPLEMNHYHEIFLGGGSVLLTVLSYIKNGIVYTGAAHSIIYIWFLIKFYNYKMTCMDNFSKKQEILKIYNYWNKFNLLNKYNKI